LKATRNAPAAASLARPPGGPPVLLTTIWIGWAFATASIRARSCAASVMSAAT